MELTSFSYNSSTRSGIDCKEASFSRQLAELPSPIPASEKTPGFISCQWKRPPPFTLSIPCQWNPLVYRLFSLAGIEADVFIPCQWNPPSPHTANRNRTSLLVAANWNHHPSPLSAYRWRITCTAPAFKLALFTLFTITAQRLETLFAGMNSCFLFLLRELVLLLKGKRLKWGRLQAVKCSRIDRHVSGLIKTDRLCVALSNLNQRK